MTTYDLDLARVGDGDLRIARRTPSSSRPRRSTSTRFFARRAARRRRRRPLGRRGVKAGPGDDVDEAEELDRVVPVVTELVARFDVPISVDTWRASVAGAAFAEGATIGNDISGFADDVTCRSRRGRRGRRGDAHPTSSARGRPDPHYDDVTATVRDVPRRARASARSRPVSRGTGSCSTPGWTSARPRPSRCSCCGTPTRSPDSARRSALGVEQDVPRRAVRPRGHRSPRAVAGRDGARHRGGCRIVRVHDVAGRSGARRDGATARRGDA